MLKHLKHLIKITMGILVKLNYWRVFKISTNFFFQKEYKKLNPDLPAD